MQAMVLTAAQRPLERQDRGLPPGPGPHQVLVKVHACGVCRTDLHIIDGELTQPKLPLVPGHEIVGTVAAVGAAVDKLHIGDRVGVPWLGWSCGECVYCRSGRENLCALARFTGYEIDGGYAEYTLADARYCFHIPEKYGDIEAAPLMCAGLIGYRALRMAGEAERIGLYGFGAAAHILAQIAHHRGHQVYAFTKPGDVAGQEFARGLGATWAGGSDETPSGGLMPR
jgi:alcohol dehydrogenase, propanol-preferring